MFIAFCLITALSTNQTEELLCSEGVLFDNIEEDRNISTDDTDWSSVYGTFIFYIFLCIVCPCCNFFSYLFIICLYYSSCLYFCPPFYTVLYFSFCDVAMFPLWDQFEVLSIRAIIKARDRVRQMKNYNLSKSSKVSLDMIQNVQDYGHLPRVNHSIATCFKNFPMIASFFLLWSK